MKSFDMPRRVSFGEAVTGVFQICIGDQEVRIHAMRNQDAAGQAQHRDADHDGAYD